MQKIIFICFTIFLYNSTLRSQNIQEMKFFDEKVLKDWKVDKKDFAFPQPDKYLKKGNKRIHIIYDENIIFVSETDVISPYEYISAYDSLTKQQLAKGQKFYLCEIAK